MKLDKLFHINAYNLLRKIYITIFIIAVLTRVFLPVAMKETQFVNSLIFSIVAVFGGSIVCLDIFTKRIFLKQKNIIWLILFWFACLISSIINIRYGFIGNVRNLVWLCISFFLLYPIDQERSSSEIKKEIKYVSNFLIVVWFIACCISFFMFLMQIGFYVDIFPDSFARMGFIECRLFGVFEDPNYAAVVAFIVIIFSLFNIKTNSKIFLKIFYAINILINFFYIILSGSRTAEVSAFVATAFVAYFILLKKLKFKNLNYLLKQFISILAALFCSAALIFSMNLTRKFLSYLPDFINSPFETTSISEPRVKKHIETNREDVNNSADISNCRFKIWLSALELFKSRPIFGTSPRNMRAYAKAEFPSGFIAQRSYAVHNAYLDVLTSTGIIGAFMLIVFFVKYLIYIFRFLLLNTQNKNYYMVLFCFSIVVTVAVSAFFLSEILFVNTIGVLVFWLSLGYSCYFSEKN